MKKIKLFIGALLLGLIIFVGCSTESYQEYIAKQINIKIPNVLDIKFSDEHKGFHGDGETYAKVKFDIYNGQKIEWQIANNKSWNELPLTENLSLIMYGGERDNIEYTYNFSEKLGIPHIENGYWFFVDRHTESIFSERDTELFERSSFNFTLVMYNTDNNTLHYFEFDT